MTTNHTDDPTLTIIRVGDDEKTYHEGGRTDKEEANDVDASGLAFPTDEEQATLRRVADSLPWGAYSKFVLTLWTAPLVYSDHLSTSDRHGGISRKVLCELHVFLF